MNAFLEFALLGYESYPKVHNLKLLAIMLSDSRSDCRSG